jgi:predicted RNA-binding Zn-ribbon protein involved in translation (DUF1610 family)
MPADTTSCPYCNAYVTIPEGGTQKLSCPRCGESFSYRPAGGAESGYFAAGGGPAGSLIDDRFARPSMRRPSNRLMAAGLVGLMLLMALISLMVGLKTVPFRRSHDPQDPLAFLPSDTNVIALVRVQQALQEVPGRQLLSQLYLGAPGADLGLLEQWTGLRRDDIQTAVLGLHVGSDFIPRVTLVVQTQVPYDEAAVAASLKEAERIERGSRTLYRVPMRGGGLSATLWFASESIVVACLTPQDFDRVPETPASGTPDFGAPLQGFIRDRVAAEDQAWIIGHDDHWEDTVAHLVLSGLTVDYPQLLSDLSTWGFTLHFDQGVKISAACEMKNEQAAQRLARYVTRYYLPQKTRSPERVSAAMGLAAGPVSGLGAVAELIDSHESAFRIGPGAWVSFRFQAKPNAILGVLRRPIADAIPFPGR